MNQRLQKIKEVTIRKPYVFYFLLVLIIYLTLNSVINQTYITNPILLSSYKLSFSIPYIILSIFVALLVALNVNLIIFKLKEYRQINKASSLSLVGVFGGILGGACPGCFVGLFPAFIGLFGISATLGNLPFLGLEIQVASIILLVIGVILLTKENVCKVNFPKN
ncbi:hypothetical protein CMI46_02355 [Candidatus Pacearchaeota archaeon]|nr:hypothetical protein [Candidatus Pacearchaeota archaeon]